MALKNLKESLKMKKVKRAFIHGGIVSLIGYAVACRIFGCDVYSFECGYIVGIVVLCGVVKELVK